MKTDNVYFAVLNVVTDVEKGEESGYCLRGIPMHDHIISYKPLKPVLLLCKIDKYGKRVIRDLNTKEEYSFKVHSQLGTIFVNAESLYPFNEITDNTEKSLSKRKILKIGNQALCAITKEMKNKEENN